MKPSAKRAFSLLLSALLLVAALFTYGLFIKTEYSQILKLRAKLTGQRVLFQEKQQAIAKVESLIKQYQGSGRLQDTIALSLPNKEDLAAVFNQLQALADFNGLAIEIFNVQALPIKPAGSEPGRRAGLVRGLGTLRLSLRIAGSYESLKGFLRGLETNIRVMDLVNLKIESLAKGLLLYNLVVDTYYQTQ